MTSDEQNPRPGRAVPISTVSAPSGGLLARQDRGAIVGAVLANSKAIELVLSTRS